MNVFTPGLEIGKALGEVADRGITYIPGVLNGNFANRLMDVIGALRFEAVSETTPAGVKQGFARMIMPKQPPFVFEILRKELVQLVRRCDPGITNLAYFEPNDTAVCLYNPNKGEGITSHKDESRYRLLVATLTIQGYADLVASHDREETRVVGGWRTAPNGLMLLRGPGLGGIRDGRLFHSIGCPIRWPRISVGFRMNTKS